ncbi:NAD-dependent epimerase/dehydratase family protein [Candidatus Bipolaricaulota bacterium]
MRIVFSGGTGFVGRYLLKELANSDETVVLTRSGHTQPETKEADADRATYVVIDYSVESLSRHLVRADAVVHLAARRHEPSLLMRDYVSNIEVSANLWEACRITGIKNIVSVSTIAVYGQAEPLPWRESYACLPMTFYGVSRLAAERSAEIYNRKHGLRIKSLRCAQVTGVGTRSTRMLSEFLQRARSKSTLLVYGKESGRRQYIYVRDVVRAIRYALARIDARGPFNIGMQGNWSHTELAELFHRVFENKGNIEFLSGRTEDTSEYLMSIDRARSELGWEPRWGLIDALKGMRVILESESPPDAIR